MKRNADGSLKSRVLRHKPVGDSKDFCMQCADYGLWTIGDWVQSEEVKV